MAESAANIIEKSTNDSAENKANHQVDAGLSGQEVVLNKDIRIRFNDSLKHLDKGTIKAYRAVSSSRQNVTLFALILDKSLTPRISLLSKFFNINNPALCKFIASGVVDWPLDKRQHYCMVYEDILGMPLASPKETSVALGISPDLVLENIVPPMIGLLRELRNKEVYHGELWLGNIFDGGSKTSQKVIVGECLSSPAASQLPTLYEPIERAMSDPIGRGIGDNSDDLYSLGVCLALILRTADPLKGLNDDQIIDIKIEKGSYFALMGKDRLGGSLLELLRGLLFDDPKQRWTIEDLEDWSDGRRLTPKQAPKRIKANRPLIFQDVKYTRPEIFAKDMRNNPHEVLRLYDTGEMEQWIDRAIEDKIVKSRWEQAKKEIEAIEKGSGFEERAIIPLAVIFYPDMCVRYRDISFTLMGFGKYLTYAYVKQKNIQTFVDVLKYNFVLSSLQYSRILDKRSILSKFDTCRNLIKQKVMNTGLEKCLYHMDNEAPCLSPILDKFYCLDTEDVITSMNKLCEMEKPDILFDRHIIAFLSTKDKQNIDPYIADLTSSIPYKRAMAQLFVFATIQKRLGLDNFPALAKWIFHNLEPVFNRLHDSKKRDEVKKQIGKLAQEGNLKSMALNLEDRKIYEEDMHFFYQAMNHYRELVDEEEFIKKELSKGNNYGENTGRQIASIISFILSFSAIMVILYQIFSKV